VTPYFGYGRQDRKDEGRVPITAKLVANLITAAHADRVLALDLHAAQIQGFFDLPVDHLSATPVFLDYFQSIRERARRPVPGEPGRGQREGGRGMANLLGGDLAIINKQRVSAGRRSRTGNLIGSVEDKTVLMFDDMISTAGTVCEAAKLVMERGAAVIAAATHGVLVRPGDGAPAGEPDLEVVVTNTIPLGPRVARCGKLVELCVGPLLGEAIHRIHNNESRERPVPSGRRARSGRSHAENSDSENDTQRRKHAMHENSSVLTATRREQASAPGTASACRQAGSCPAVVYGHGEAPVAIAVDAKRRLPAHRARVRRSSRLPGSRTRRPRRWSC
jgi:ribose-phosphate pyrophosphokinase